MNIQTKEDFINPNATLADRKYYLAKMGIKQSTLVRRFKKSNSPSNIHQALSNKNREALLKIADSVFKNEPAQGK